MRAFLFLILWVVAVVVVVNEYYEPPTSMAPGPGDPVQVPIDYRIDEFGYSSRVPKSGQ